MAPHSFDTLQKPDDILRVNFSCAEFDKQLFDRIFVADEIENMLGVDLDDPPPCAPKLETPTPPAPTVTVSFYTLIDMYAWRPWCWRLVTNSSHIA